MMWLGFIGVAVAGYFLGSIPTGYLAGRCRGIDIRRLGSGNIGATNVMRFLGRPVGVAVLLTDALKGYLACTVLVSGVMRLPVFGVTAGTLPAEWLALTGGVSAILGHNYTCWLGFKGGKGIATSAGVLLGLMPAALLVCLAVWGVVFGVSRYVSLASILAAASLPPAVFFTHGSGAMISVSVFLAIMAIYKHRSNIQRLIQGQEHRFGSRPKEAKNAHL
ncbi:MAG TPA: glycerol-3-phosphate 1-O-acyltransferase PlsY [Verrucomicrobiota bacterium]|nr:glycerol-3-phosphate 1-O-acyltransferase PlsY [Verrucomicrobiota bacterium]